jgi:hypothetical protein
MHRHELHYVKAPHLQTDKRFVVKLKPTAPEASGERSFERNKDGRMQKVNNQAR